MATDGSGSIRRLEISIGHSPVFVGSASTVLSIIRPEVTNTPGTTAKQFILTVPAVDPGLRIEALGSLGVEVGQLLPISTLRIGHDRIYSIPIDPDTPAKFFRLLRLP